MTMKPIRFALLLSLTFAASCLPAPSAAASVLSGVIFVDDDMNGQWDRMSEWVLPDVSMRLTAQNDPAFSVVVSTNEFGRFQFDDLKAGVYDVEQVHLLPEYVSVTIDVGLLVDMTSGSLLDSGFGMARQYSQSQGIMPAVVSIEIPDETTLGVDYNFGQIWWGKFMYLGNDPGDPPGAVPPPENVIPEPSTALLVLAGALCLLRRRRRSR